MAEQNSVQYFTVEEARAALVVIRPLVAEMQAIRQAILEKEPQVWPVIASAAGNGGSEAASQMVEEFDRLDELVRQVRATGAVIKDINAGLVDFFSLREGRAVFLCWQHEEDDLLYWHDLDAGFAGRQLL